VKVDGKLNNLRSLLFPASTIRRANQLSQSQLFAIAAWQNIFCFGSHLYQGWMGTSCPIIFECAWGPTPMTEWLNHKTPSFLPIPCRRWPRLNPRPPRQILGGQINEHRPKNQNQANPESPIAMCKFPVRTRTMLTAFTTIRIWLVPTVIYFMHGLNLTVAPDIHLWGV
jgi:hypothetical protein